MEKVIYAVERNDDHLAHWGIKGQKWGIRRYQNDDGTLTEAGKKRYRYQNPDGSLTEEGMKDYMTAARKGKLDPTKLPDKELDMINARFAKEKNFANNVADYKKSQFSYKLKEAMISRIKGGGGGKGKGGGKKGGSTIGKILATPIKQAFEQAFKDNGGGGSGNEKEDPNDVWYENTKKQRSFISGYDPAPDKFEADLKRGQSAFWGSMSDWKSQGSKGWKTKRNEDQSKISGRTAEDVVRDRYRNRNATPEPAKPPKQPKQPKKKQDYSFWDSYMGHGIMFKITRSDDYLMHHGIKGQKWGVRRFQNEDGTWTNVGKERYSISRKEYRQIVKSGKDDEKEFRRDKKEAIRSSARGEQRNRTKAMYAQYEAGMNKSRAVLEKNAGHKRVEKKYLKKADELQGESDRLKAKEYEDFIKLSRKALVPGNYKGQQELAKKQIMKNLANDSELQKRAKNEVKIHTDMYDDHLTESGYKKLDAKHKKAEKELREYAEKKAEEFIKEYFSNPKAKLKTDEASIKQYKHWVQWALESYSQHNVELDY